MNILIPPPPPNYQAQFFDQAFATIRRALTFGVSRIEAVDSIILSSPNGTPFKITVSDAGVITATQVPRGQTGSPNY